MLHFANHDKGADSEHKIELLVLLIYCSNVVLFSHGAPVLENTSIRGEGSATLYNPTWMEGRWKRDKEHIWQLK